MEKSQIYAKHMSLSDKGFQQIIGVKKDVFETMLKELYTISKSSKILLEVEIRHRSKSCVTRVIKGFASFAATLNRKKRNPKKTNSQPLKRPKTAGFPRRESALNRGTPN
jgi:hypothetical protein